MSRKKKQGRKGGPEDGSVRGPEDGSGDKAGAEDPAKDGAHSLPDENAQRLAELDGQVKELTDRLLRKTAEFANYQKRIHKEMDDARRFAARPLALELLSVIDSFERALGSRSEGTSEDAGTGTEDTGADVETAGADGTESILQGLRLIHDQLKSALSNHGIVPIVALNETFDPNLHDAIMEEENPDLPDKTVIEELVKGYMLHDRLLRPARVRVSRTPRPAEDEKEDLDSDDGADGEDPDRGEDENES